jgi:hypothetical protein
MTLTCTWVKDPAGALVMTWTADEAPLPQPRNAAASHRNPSTRHHEPRATGLVPGAMLPAWHLPEMAAANTVPAVPAQATPPARIQASALDLETAVGGMSGFMSGTT